jgi:hypothetical protein
LVVFLGQTSLIVTGEEAADADAGTSPAEARSVERHRIPAVVRLNDNFFMMISSFLIKKRTIETVVRRCMTQQSSVTHGSG